MSLQEKIARWMWDEFGEWWSWDKMPQRKREYYMNKANELIKECGILDLGKMVSSSKPLVCEELIQSMAEEYSSRHNAAARDYSTDYNYEREY